jgi:hypothetical protein
MALGVSVVRGAHPSHLPQVLVTLWYFLIIYWMQLKFLKRSVTANIARQQTHYIPHKQYLTAHIPLFLLLQEKYHPTWTYCQFCEIKYTNCIYTNTYTKVTFRFLPMFHFIPEIL